MKQSSSVMSIELLKEVTRKTMVIRSVNQDDERSDTGERSKFNDWVQYNPILNSPNNPDILVMN